MADLYPPINGTLLNSDLGYIFVYANQVTGGLAIPIILLAFFLVVFLGSLFMQMRMTTRMRPEVSYLAASFATLGFTTIMASIVGINLTFWLWVSIVMTFIGVLWVMLTAEY